MDDPPFYSDVWHRISTFLPCALIWGGDFNVCLDITADRAGNSEGRVKQASEALLGLCEVEHLHDIWRIRHLGSREGTFVSTVHGSWSRLDFWLVSEEVCTWAREVKHEARTLSDHSPVTLDLQIPTYERPPFSWRLQPAELTDPVFAQTITEKITNFFKEN